MIRALERLTLNRLFRYLEDSPATHRRNTASTRLSLMLRIGCDDLLFLLVGVVLSVIDGHVDHFLRLAGILQELGNNVRHPHQRGKRQN